LTYFHTCIRLTFLFCEAVDEFLISFEHTWRNTFEKNQSISFKVEIYVRMLRKQFVYNFLGAVWNLCSPKKLEVLQKDNFVKKLWKSWKTGDNEKIEKFRKLVCSKRSAEKFYQWNADPQLKLKFLLSPMISSSIKNSFYVNSSLPVKISRLRNVQMKWDRFCMLLISIQYVNVNFLWNFCFSMFPCEE
jgi:hypothetical protein